MKRKKKRFGSRSKGANGEREAAAILEKWWSPLEPGCKFKKTPMSGGWSTSDVRGAFDAAGDLVTTAKKFPYCVEVKRREGWSEKTFFAGKKSPVWGWWAQAVRQAAEVKKIPMLMFRKNHQEWLFIVPDWADHIEMSPEGAIAFDRTEHQHGWVVCSPLANLLEVPPEDIVAYFDDADTTAPVQVVTPPPRKNAPRFL